MSIQPSDSILIVDFGSQVTQLIARRVREAGVYSEIAPFSLAEAAFARQVMQGIVGPERVLEQEPTLGGEDFAYMLQAKPGAYCFIANGEGGHRSAGHGAGPCTLHNPSYDFNDELIPLGATYWVQLAQQWLAQR